MIHRLGWEEEERLALIAKERYSSLGLEGDELVKEEFRTKYEELNKRKEEELEKLAKEDKDEDSEVLDDITRGFSYLIKDLELEIEKVINEVIDMDEKDREAGIKELPTEKLALYVGLLTITGKSTIDRREIILARREKRLVLQNKDVQESVLGQKSPNNAQVENGIVEKENINKNDRQEITESKGEQKENGAKEESNSTNKSPSTITDRELLAFCSLAKLKLEFSQYKIYREKTKL